LALASATGVVVVVVEAVGGRVVLVVVDDEGAVIVVVVEEVGVVLVVVELVVLVVLVVEEVVVEEVVVVDSVSVAPQQAVPSSGATSNGTSSGTVGVKVIMKAATSIDVGLPMHEAGKVIENCPLVKETTGVHGSTALCASSTAVASSPWPALANSAT